MALLWLEAVNSLYDYFKDDTSFSDANVHLGFASKILRESHIRVQWGTAGLVEDASGGEFESQQQILIEIWVFDEDGNLRRKAYEEHAKLIRAVTAKVYEWLEENELELTLTMDNHGDAFAPSYGCQLALNTTVQHDVPACDMSQAFAESS